MVDERWFTVEEAAEIMKVSQGTLRDWLRTGQLRGTMLGGRKIGWRIAESEIGRALREGLHPKADR
jgi:excisionase family DNA binding protein